MSATNAAETSILALIFNATTWDGIAENDTTSPATQYYISLHTASPGEAGDQTTSETGYTGYARIAVNRNSGGWTVSGNSAVNAAEILFGLCTANPDTLTYVGLGTASSGAGSLILYNPLNSSLILAAGAQPRFAAGNLTFTAD